jgi:hypothetical protein
MVSCFTVYKINLDSPEESRAEADRYVAYGDDFQKCFRSFFSTFINDVLDSDTTIETMSVVSEINLRALFDNRSTKLDVKSSEGTFAYIIYAEGSISGISIAYKMNKIDMSAYNCGEICTDILNNNTYDYAYCIYSPEGEPMSFQRRHVAMTDSATSVAMNHDIEEYLENTSGVRVKHYPRMYAITNDACNSTNPNLPAYCGWIECSDNRKLANCIITRHVW